jgi:hypothetical protein
MNNKISLPVLILSFSVFDGIFIYFSEYYAVQINFGNWFLAGFLISHFLISLLLGLFISGMFHRWKLEKKTSLQVGQNSFFVFLAWITGILVTSCPSCSFTLLAWFGASGAFLAWLPWQGLAFNLISILMLSILNYRFFFIQSCRLK